VSWLYFCHFVILVQHNGYVSPPRYSQRGRSSSWRSTTHHPTLKTKEGSDIGNVNSPTQLVKLCWTVNVTYITTSFVFSVGWCVVDRQLLLRPLWLYLWGETYPLCWTKIAKWQKYGQNTTICMCWTVNVAYVTTFFCFYRWVVCCRSTVASASLTISLRWDIPVVLNQNYKMTKIQSKHNYMYVLDC